MSTGDDRRNTALATAASAMRSPLDMRRAATLRRVNALFRAMSTDFLLREQFVTDPAQVVSEYVRGARLPADESELINHLVHAVMSNRKLLVWLRDYARTHRGHPPPPETILRDFSRAIVTRDAHHVAQALMRSALAEKNVLRVVQEGLTDVLFYEPGIFADTDGTGGEEGTGPGTGGTDEGTEMTPGTNEGTEQSTGTSTEKSGFEFFGSQFVLTMNALVQYSVHLRDAGALELSQHTIAQHIAAQH